MRKYFLFLNRVSFFLFLLFALCSLPYAKHAFADQNFTTSFDVTYTVSPDGMTHAVFNGILQNQNDNSYPAAYTLKTGFEGMTHVVASDADGAINAQLQTDNSQTSITLPFNVQSIGLGSKLPFTFSFDTQNLATHVGNIWEINIPGLADASDFNNFTVHLRVPESFGQPSYVKPAIVGSSLDFDKNALGTSGISLAFGNIQSFNFTLHYHLQNSQIFPVNTEIALPPTTNYQSVAIYTINPKPKNVTEDLDGNWLAQYSLAPTQEMDVTVTGNTLLSLTPTQQPLSQEDRTLYLRPQQYWEQNDQIKQLASQLQTPQAIYEYVVGHLHYDFSRIAGDQQRLGAAYVLQNPTSAVCLEFTDLFIALARSAGIPAREIDGFAYTQNTQERPLSLVKDVLHAWPEYYDDQKQTWIMVDPTWENTTGGTDYFHTMDFDHFAFVVKGLQSTYPIPAGGYKVNDQNSKDVFVTFGQNTTQQDPQIAPDFAISQKIFSGSNIFGTLLLSNVGQTLVTSQKVLVSAPNLSTKSQTVTTSDIPPFGSTAISLQFGSTNLLTNKTIPITISIGEKKLTKDVTVYPLFFQNKPIIFFVGGGIIFVILCIIISIIAKRTWRLLTA